MEETLSGPIDPRVDPRASEILQPGTVIAGRYAIKRHLAAGGMGRVYVAEQQPLGRTVALKVMHHELVKDSDAVKRFFREAVAVSQLTHPNTITVFDFGESADGNFYIAMEYLEGEPLSARLTREGPLAPGTAVQITIQVARSLSEAHRKNIIHRDLKPENVFLGNVEKDLVKVLDFGIAKILQEESDGGTKLTRMGFVCGTPEYMSPEQARGEDLDGRSDLYALGVLLFEVLSGGPPFAESTPLATVLKHQNDAPPALPDSVPVPLCDFIASRALAKNRDGRPASAEEFIHELETAAITAGLMLDSTGSLPVSDIRRAVGAALGTSETVALGQLTPREQPAAAAGRKRLLLVAAALALALGGGGVAWLLSASSEADSKTAEAATASPSKPDAPPQDPTTPEGPRPPTDEPAGTAPSITLAFTSLPEGAKVFEDGVELGETPLELAMDDGGVARNFTFRLDGHASVQQTVRVPAAGDEPVTLSVYAELPALVLVPVASEPAGALVYVDDEPAGATPLELSLVPDEATELRFEAEGYDTTTLQLTPAADSPVAVELKKRRTTRSRGKHTGSSDRDPDPAKLDDKPKDGGTGYRPFGD